MKPQYDFDTRVALVNRCGKGMAGDATAFA
jgi:hypothetical protein